MRYYTFLILLIMLAACGSEEDEVLVIQTRNPVVMEETGCQKTLTCFETCDENASCIERCIQSQEADEASKAVGVAICLDVARDGCFTDACRLEACSNYLDICFDDVLYNCGQVVDCQERCLDGDCEGRCSDLASIEARTKMDNIFICFGECSDDPECVDRRCWDEISTCRDSANE